MTDTNAPVEAITQIASDPNAANWLMSTINLVFGMFQQAMGLVAENSIWIIVIAGLTWAVDNWVMKFAPIPKGWVRYFLSFLVVMFFSALWIGILRGFINGM